MNMSGRKYIKGIDRRWSTLMYVIKSVSYVSFFEPNITRKAIQERMYDMEPEIDHCDVNKSSVKELTELATATLREDKIKEFNNNLLDQNVRYRI